MCCRTLDLKEFFDVHFSDANTILVCCRCCGTSPHPLNIPHNDRPRQTEESLQVVHTLHRSPNSPLLNFRTEITG